MHVEVRKTWSKPTFNDNLVTVLPYFKLLTIWKLERVSSFWFLCLKLSFFFCWVKWELSFKLNLCAIYWSHNKGGKRGKTGMSSERWWKIMLPRGFSLQKHAGMNIACRYFLFLSIFMFQLKWFYGKSIDFFYFGGWERVSWKE